MRLQIVQTKGQTWAEKDYLDWNLFGNFVQRNSFKKGNRK